jgi:hypothetical protein
MSSLIENELANDHISAILATGNKIKSKYNSRDNYLVFGQGDGDLYTEVNVSECVHMITKSSDKNLMLINLLTINLCSAFESFLFELFEYYLRRSSDVIINSQKSMKLQEVFKFNTIEDVKEDLIRREIMDFGFQSLEKQIGIIQKNFNVDFGFSTEMRVAKRIFTKRNSIVHNEGRVNKELIELLTEEQKDRNLLDEKISTTEFEFGEEIYLLNLMGTRMITLIK